MSSNKNRLFAALRLTAGVAGYYAISILGTYLLTRLFSGLFGAWGVTSLNISRAPGWAQWLASNYGNIISALLSALTALGLGIAARKKRREKSRPVYMAAALTAGMAAVLLIAAIFLLTDSLRLVSRAADPNLDMLTLAAVYLAAAWAEQALARDYVFSACENRPIKYAVSAAIFLLMGKAWTLGVLGFINMALISLALCAVTEKFGGGAALCLRFGWSWALTCLISFPGGTARALYVLYPVSENLLTGGAKGLITGLSATIIWAAAAWLLLIGARLPRIPTRK